MAHPSRLALLVAVLIVACGGTGNAARSHASPSPSPVAPSPSPSPLDPVTAAYFKVLESVAAIPEDLSVFANDCQYGWVPKGCRQWVVADERTTQQAIGMLSAAKPPAADVTLHQQLLADNRAELAQLPALVKAIDAGNRSDAKTAVGQIAHYGGESLALMGEMDPNLSG